MRTTRPFLAGVTLMICSAGTAVAQEPPPEGEAPPQGEYPPQGEAPPPTYAPQPGYPPPQQPVENAPPPPADAHFGAVGQIAISDDLRIAISRTSQSSPYGGSNSATSYQLRPAMDYFIAPSFSIGAELLLDYLSGNGTSQTDLGLTPRVGYDFNLSSVVSIWPRVGLGYLRTSASFAGGGSSSTSYAVTFNVFVPVVFHPAPHFFIGGGPYLSTYLVSKLESNDAPKLTETGLMSLLGGYFGGM